ncbi:MAG: hypothetical protein ACI8RD_003485 [Bacillariaceae sp.]|jgi:hypothetical protein
MKSSSSSSSSSRSSRSSFDEIQLKENLFKAGFDICHGPFLPKIYNDRIEKEGLIESGTLFPLPETITTLPTTDSDSDNDNDNNDDTSGILLVGSSNNNKKQKQQKKTKAYLIGNTKHLWPIFLRWLDDENKKEIIKRNNKEGNSNDEEIHISDPLDTYEQTVIENIVRRELSLPVCGDTNNESGNSNIPYPYYDLYYSSVYLNPKRLISMGRIASYAGFSYLDDETHLNIHPEYGTWHSYRAVLLVEVDEEEEEEEEEANSGDDVDNNALSMSLSSLISEEEAIASKLAFDNALQISSTIGIDKNDTNDNEEDVHIAVDIIKDQLCEELGEGKYNTTTAADTDNDNDRRNNNNRKAEIPLAWMELRNSISIGREKYKYDNNQLLYHYTKDDRCLIDGIKQLNK